jgi:hypothetical protein
MNTRPIGALLVLASVFEARALADTVHLKNSDRLTGTIDRLEEGKLYLDTDYAGTISISWEQVAAIASDKAVQVESGSGLLFTGRISGSDESLEVRTEALGVLHLAGIQAILPAESAEEAEGSGSTLSGSVDLGLNLARGNSHANQFSANVAVRYRADAFEISSEVDSLFSKSSASVGTSRHAGWMRLDRYLAPGRFTFLLGSVERDEGEGLALRTKFGGGLGWHVVNSRGLQLSLLAGSSLVRERFRELDYTLVPSEGGTELLFSLNLERALIGRNILTSKLSLHPHLLRPGRVRMSFDTALRIPIAGPLTLTLRSFERFNNTPHAGAKPHDYGFLSGFGVAF